MIVPEIIVLEGIYCAGICLVYIHMYCGNTFYVNGNYWSYGKHKSKTKTQKCQLHIRLPRFSHVHEFKREINKVICNFKYVGHEDGSSGAKVHYFRLFSTIVCQIIGYFIENQCYDTLFLQNWFQCQNSPHRYVHIIFPFFPAKTVT
jgi:hypothetical protein